jgi:cell division protein FtsB
MGRSKMVWLGLLSAVALAVALAAFASVRRLRRRLEQLQQSYWDLRYEHGRLKAQVKQLDPEASAPAETPEPAPAASTTFIPLSSLKR